MSPKTLLRLTTLVTAAAFPGFGHAEVLTNLNGVVRNLLCVGQNCADNEFSISDDLIIKDNSNRVFFDDVSTSSNPDNDWRIILNDSASGSEEYFAVEDATLGRKIFQVSAGAPEAGIFMASTGRIGFGTNMPLREFHIVDSNLVTMRFDQRGGSSPVQVWDLNANHNGFWVSDASGGQIPFLIEPRAPDASLNIETSGFVGLGTDSPEEKLHIRTTANNQDAFALFDAAGSGADAAFLLRQQGNAPTTWEFRNQQSSGRLNVGIAGGNTPLKIDDGANNNLLRLGLNNGSDIVSVTGRLLVNNTQLNVPDFVFHEDYDLRPLAEVQNFIDTNRHLPDIPSAAQIADEGVDMTALQMALLQKVEELTLYTLAQEKADVAQRARIAALEKTIETLLARQ